MTDITSHPLVLQAYEVCLAIESCGASPQLTAAGQKASALYHALGEFFPPEYAGELSDEDKAAIERGLERLRGATTPQEPTHG